MNDKTSMTLLARLKDTADQEAWDKFYGFYAPLIMRYSLDKGCNPEQAAEVIQETFVNLMTAMPDFTYKPGKGQFRSFLLTIVHRRISDTFRRRKRLMLPLREDEAVTDDVVDSNMVHPVFGWEERWKENLLHQALELIKVKMHFTTYRSFEMLELEGKSADEVARTLGIKRNAVYQHRRRVHNVLTQEIRNLEKEWDDGYDG